MNTIQKIIIFKYFAICCIGIGLIEIFTENYAHIDMNGNDIILYLSWAIYCISKFAMEYIKNK